MFSKYTIQNKIINIKKNKVPMKNSKEIICKLYCSTNLNYYVIISIII